MRYLRQVVSKFTDDDCPTMAAALAYSTLFSLPPLLLILISVAGLALGRGAVEGGIQEQIQGLIGSGAATAVQSMVQNASQQPSKGLLGAVVGVIVLLMGASAAFAQLQASLNKIWGVKPDPRRGGIRSF